MTEKFEVVISGMSGRFPECDDVNTFKQKLYNKEEFLTIDNRKWPVGYKYKLGEKIIPDATGKFTKVHQFDYRVFKINKLSAISSDVLNRKVLEPAFEAIVDAGINPYSLDGQNVGVFMSCGTNDVDNNLFGDNREILSLIGSNKTMLSNRVSFAFNLTGPSFTYFADVLGGMEALATGYKYISDGFVDAAIVGVSASIIDPKVGFQLVALGLLSPDGCTRAFDKFAEGYGRSEGVVVFYLQREKEAKRSYGTIKLCDTYYYGSNPSTLLGYNENYLKSALERIYQRHKYTDRNSWEIAFLEMTAYGCKRLEKIESNVIASLFCKNRNKPLLIGSVKSNTGHTEAAAGLMSVMKALMALDTGVIAPNKNFSQINDEIEALKDGRLQVVTSPTTLPGTTIAVNSIGLCGTVAQAIIQQNKKKPEADPSVEEKLPRLLLICGRTEDDLRKVVEKIEGQPYNAEFVALANDAFTQHMPLHVYRAYTILPKPFKAIHGIEERGDQNRPVWFLFSGMGSQWNGMGKGLLDLPIFANTVARCDKILQPKGVDIYNILTTDNPTVFDDILNAFVGIVTIQVGLVEVLKVLGIEPDGIIGHSTGENACAYADGCLTLEQAVLAAWARGVASLEAQTIKGMMAAIGKGYTAIKPLLPEGIEVACHNSMESSTLSGPAEKVSKFVEQLQKEGVFARTVNAANIAYHSKYLAPAGPILLSRLKKVIQNPKPRSSKWISTSVPESNWDTPLTKHCSAEYLTNNLLNPVLFEEGCKHIPNNAIVIELAPHGIFQAILKRSSPDTCTNVPLTMRSKTRDNLNFLLSAIGKLYIAGLEPNVNNLFPKIDYPVSRGTPSISPLCTWYHDADDVCPRHLTPKKDAPLSNESILIDIKEDSEYAYLRYHKINDQVVIPPSFFMYLTWWIHSYQRNEKLGTASVIFENVKIHKLITVSLQNSRSVSIMIQHGSGDFEVLLENESNADEVNVIISGRITVPYEDLPTTVVDTRLFQDGKVKINRVQFYETFRAVGYQLSDCFTQIQELSGSNTDYFGKITWNHNWVTLLDSLMKFQMFSDVKTNADLLYPSRIRRLAICSSELSSMKTGCIILCHADLVTKRLVGNGIEMSGMQCHMLSSNADSEHGVQLRGLQFVSHENPRCQNIEEFLTLCVQLAVEDLSLVNGAKLCIASASGMYSRVIKNIVEGDNYLQSSISLCAIEEVNGKTISKDKCFMLVTDLPKDAVNINADYEFILAVVPSEEHIHSIVQLSFIKITQQTFSGYVFCLMKKKSFQNGHKPLVFFDERNRIHYQYAIDDTEHETKSSVFLVRKNIEFADLNLMLAKQKKHSRIRYLFIMDKENPCRLTEKSLERQIMQDLPITIYRHGEWGSYRNLSKDQENLRKSDQIQVVESFLSDLCLESLQVKYVCLDGGDSYDNTQEFQELGIGYAGTRSSGERIIGLANISSHEESSSMVDLNLSWYVPKEWSLEEAATVPYNYSQAYNILFLMNTMRTIKSILINMENESSLIEACISLSLYKGYEVYMTVADDQDVGNIKQKFPMLKHVFVLGQNENKLDITILLQTEGKGVDMIINFRSGWEHVTASLNCITQFGLYVEVGENNCKDTNQLGLQSFLESVTFITIPNKISSLLNLDEEKKKNLNQLLRDGIRNGVVVPSKITQQKAGVESTLLQHQKVIKCKSGNEVHHSTNKKLRYDSNHSYIIIGGGRKKNSWFDLVELLLARGARKFIVALENLSVGPRVSNQINRLLSQKRATIVLTSSSKLDNFQDSEQLATEASKIAPLEAVFFISVDSVGSKIHNLDAVVPPNVHFVCLFSGGLTECESRRFNGSPAILVHCEKTEDIPTVFHEVDNILANFDNNNSCVFYEVVNQNQTSKKKRIDTTLHDYFPKNIDSLRTIGCNVSEKVKFVEMTSLGLRFQETRGVYPVFVLPALHGTLLEPLLRKLLYPVFCAMLVESNISVTDMSKDLLQSLNMIQPTGPVTLISETWNLNIALELKSLIALTGRPSKLFILEGNPTDWQKRMKHLGSVNSVQFKINLIKEIFHFDSQIQTEKRLDPAISFQEKVRQCARRYFIKNRDVDSVVRIANVIHKQLLMASSFSLEDNMLTNVIMFQQHMSNEAALKLSVSSEVIVLNEPSYECFLRNPKISSTINENAVFSWWDFSVH